MAKIKILNFIPALSGGGAEQQLGYLAPELARMGHDVHIAYSKSGPDMPELPGVALHQLKSRSNYNPFLLWQLMRLIRLVKPDIIHTWILQMDILGGIAARSTRVPWVFREPSSARAYLPDWKSQWRIRIGSCAGAIISNSSGGDEYWKAELPRSRRYIIPNGLPAQKIDKVVAALPPGLTNSELPIVLYAGRLTSDASATKNLKNLLKSLALVKQQQKVLGILCGEGPQRLELEMLRHNLGLDEDIYFTGHLSSAQVLGLMKKTSIFISLSAYEGCPNTVMEAMACGCPLVVSDIPAHREFLDDQMALLADPNDPASAAKAILDILSEPAQAKARCLIAKIKSTQWSISAMAKKYEDVYREVLS